MDAATRGLLIHELLRSASIELHEQGLFSRDSDFLRAKRVLLASVSRAAASYRDQLAPAIPRVWEDAISDIGADLVRWLRETRESGWQPVHFEHEFGRPTGVASAEYAGPIRLPFGLPLQGVIDAIEQSGNSLRATDYKTGAPPEGNVLIGGGRHLQPTLYSLVLEQLFPETPVTGGNAFYCTTKGQFVRNEVPLAEPARDAAATVHRTIEAAFQDGFFPAAPLEKTCELCEFRGHLRALRAGAGGAEGCREARPAGALASPAMSPLIDAHAREVIERELGKTLVVEAAAGTGKTTALISRIVAVIRSGQTSLERVVAVTFTEKAAGEMKLRLRAELDRARHDASDPAQREHLERALAALEVAHINTIHGFCADLLREPAGRCRDRSTICGARRNCRGSAASRSVSELVRTRARRSRCRATPHVRRRNWRAERSTPREELLRACRDLVEYRDFDTPWAFPDFEREPLLDELVLRFRALGSFKNLAARASDPLARAMAEFQAFVEELDKREGGYTQKRDYYDALEVDLSEFLRGKERTIRAVGSGRLYGPSLDRSAVVGERDEVLLSLQRLVIPGRGRSGGAFASGIAGRRAGTRATQATTGRARFRGSALPHTRSTEKQSQCARTTANAVHASVRRRVPGH